MIKKLFASLGIGAAEVDTRLHTNIVSPGEQLSGEVLIRGGAVNQEIDGLSLFLMTQAEVEHGDEEFRQPLVISRVPLAASFTIRAGEQRTIPFTMQVHPETPITELSRAGSHAGSQASSVSGLFGGVGKGEGGASRGNDSAWGMLPSGARNSTKVWIHTGLDIDNGVDSSDRDTLAVRPTAPMLRFMAALESLGFVLASADVERGNLRGGGFQSTIGCYQELEYREGPGRSTGIKQLEVSFVTRPYDTGVLLEVDRRFSFGDSFRSLLMNHDTYRQVDWEREIRQVLGRSW